MKLPEIPGGKKLLYTQYDLPLVAIADFAEKGKTDPLFCGARRDLCSTFRSVECRGRELSPGAWSPHADVAGDCRISPAPSMTTARMAQGVRHCDALSPLLIERLCHLLTPWRIPIKMISSITNIATC